jgi:hypothetical protein
MVGWCFSNFFYTKIHLSEVEISHPSDHPSIHPTIHTSEVQIRQSHRRETSLMHNNTTNKNREYTSMKHTLAKLAFIILLIGQIIFYTVAFPGLLRFTAGNPNALPALLFADTTGMAAWCMAWYLDHRAAPRTWQTDVRIVVLIFWALIVFRLQFYAW